MLCRSDNDKMDNLLLVTTNYPNFGAFDIAKPLGIRKMESLRGGVGVMMDDILAGVYSLS